MHSVSMNFQFLVSLADNQSSVKTDGVKHLTMDSNLIVPKSRTFSFSENSKILVEFGSFYFDFEDRIIPIKFDDFSVKYDVIDSHTVLVTYISGEGRPVEERRLSEDYDCEYLELNITRKNLTAEALSKAYSFEDIYFMVQIENEELFTSEYDFELKSISFSDEKNEYQVSENVINNYNRYQREE